ncbi:double-strand break repair helicase AddA [Roseicyclus sp.]
MNDASLAQITAANPVTSTWLSANAGSGKTRVLTDRVARLLLQGVKPERILCLTYTKAAAMEMQNRLFRRLGEWAMMPDATLRATLEEIGEGGIDAERLRAARTLFARAIEAPGGLKIQTIHSFCAAVLRRFPLEARVSPGFTEIDERVQTRLIADLMDEMAEQDAEVLIGLTAWLGEEDGLRRLAREVAGRAEAFEPPWDWAAICDWAGIDAGLTEDALLAQVFDGDERDLCNLLLKGLNPAYSMHKAACSVIPRVAWDAPTLADLAALEHAFLNGPDVKKEPNQPRAAILANKGVTAAMGDALEALADFADRLAAARPLRLALMTARRTDALHRFAAAFLPRYQRAKALRGWLDFDDLIRGTLRLLTAEKMAQWVLFRLDGGIDHILVDEAQDTSPPQWQIVQTLAEEFAAGEGARADVTRTIFVVGDKKQSIYSFQGADPAGFDRMRAHFEARLAEVGQPFQSRELKHSFRSAPVILSLVDAVAARAGGPGVGPDVGHLAFHGAMPGRVDLWPVVEPSEKAKPPEWDDPQDIVADDHHSNILANTIATRIAAMLAAGEPLPGKDGPRPITAGDILILVQSRSPLFRKIIAALKEARLPVAGVDRSDLTAPLAVKDLIALMRFLSLPEDDLSLAAVLRSPIGGWSEDALFRLAHPRPRGASLWEVLRKAEDAHPHTVAMLRDLRNKADFLRPYDLLEQALIVHDARRRLIARLGPEAEDGIDAMLAQALNYEAMEVPSLTGFVGWLEAGEVTVKRDLAQAGGQIRVMTVHGAKGLEAPVVILPDTGYRQGRGGARIDLVTPEGGPLVWAKSVDATEAVQAALDAQKAREAEERNRLLYVAMTRAESWLIVAAAGKTATEKGGPEASWYETIRDGLETLSPAQLLLPEIAGEGLRLQSGDWTPVPPAPDASTAPPPLPGWIGTAAPPSRREVKARTPSDLGGAKIVEGADAGLDTETALRRGRLVHLLLEHLPGRPPAAWAEAAPGILALEPGETDATLAADCLSEATRVLTAPDLAPLFAPDALAEVTLTGDAPDLGGPMLGTIDRLIVTDTHILAVDFKTNAAVPATPEDTPEGLKRQMGAYAAMLAPLYPDRRIETAILWTRTATLMPLPHDVVSAALARASSA